MNYEYSVPSLKLTFSVLKMDGWKMKPFLLGQRLFSGAQMLVVGSVTVQRQRNCLFHRQQKQHFFKPWLPKGVFTKPLGRMIV